MACVIWITGLPGSGKSTVAEEFLKRHPEWKILRMDEIRRFVTPEPSYSEEEREILYRCVVYFAKILYESGISVIIDATGNRRRWRELARTSIPDFREVYLRASIELCMEREARRRELHGAPVDIYKKGSKGWPVPGITVPYEESLNPEITIDTERVTPEEAVRLIEDIFS